MTEVAPKPARRRLAYALLIGATIVLGLASRRVPMPLPAWLAKEPGDALYATMVFFGVGFVAPAVSTRQAALAATAFCFAIETSQLYQAPWIGAVRTTTLGALVLGNEFHAIDLAAYVVGVCLAVGIELAGAARLRLRGACSHHQAESNV